jgi:hypothetical protein
MRAVFVASPVQFVAESPVAISAWREGRKAEGKFPITLDLWSPRRFEAIGQREFHHRYS